MKKYLPELLMAPFILFLIIEMIYILINTPIIAMTIFFIILFIIGLSMEEVKIVKDFKYYQTQYQLKKNNERN